MFLSVLDGEGCWVWLGRFDKDEYGRINIIKDKKHQALRAHRVSYATFIGAIKDDYDIHHKCHNRACINPNHLEQIHYKVHRAETAAVGCKGNELKI